MTARAGPDAAREDARESAARPDLRLAGPAAVTWAVAWSSPRVTGAVLFLAAAAAAVSAPVLLRRPGAWRTTAAAVLACAAAAAAVAGFRDNARTTGPLVELARQEASVVLTGRLVDDPRPAQARGGARAGPDLVVARLAVELVAARGRTFAVHADAVVISAERSWLGLLPSQQVRVEGRLRPADVEDDVSAVLSGRGPPAVLSGPSGLQRAAGVLRQGLRDAVRPLPAAERGLLPGLVVGDTGGLDPALREDFRTVGLTHLVAVSGTNCSIVVGAVLLLAARAGLGLRSRLVVAALALAGFVVLARPSPSVLRASVMGAIGLLALGSGTRRAAVPALCGAVVVLLLVDPSLARSAGFALSVLATAGLLLLAGPWTRTLSRRLPLPVAAAVAVPAAAQAACGPVVVALSAQLGLLSVPANLLAAPAVAPATVAGVLAALLAPVWLPAAQAVAWVGWLPAAWLVRVARSGASLPAASVAWPGGAGGALLLALVTVTVLLALLSRPLRRGLVAASTGAGLMLSGLQVLAPAWPPPGWFAVACDVGQGDALVLSVAPGAAVVIDAGPEPGPVDACLRRLKVDTVPLLVLTHLHADHVDGLPGVLRGRRVAQVLTGPAEQPAQQFRQVQDQARAAGVPVQRPGLGEQGEVGTARWEVLAPTRLYRGTRSDPNNSSLVLRVEVRGTRILFTGDVEPEAQRDLVAGGVDLRADVLKVPHHGSDHQDPAFLAAVQPWVALTSVGAGNSYGHPSADTLGRLAAAGAQVFRTDRDGDVALVHRSGRLIVVTRNADGGPAARAPPATPASKKPGRAPQGATRRRCPAPWRSGVGGSSLWPRTSCSR